MAQNPMSPLGGFNSMLDSVEFVKKAWSSFNLPSQFAPTMDVDEIDKRIHDLKSVEQWLSLNVSMLRTTIQGLELQRNAISAVGAMSNAMSSGAEQARASMADPMPRTGSGWPTPPAPAQQAPAAAPTPAAPPVAPPVAAAEAAGARAAEASAEAAPANAGSPTAGTVGEGLMNPSAWWNLLQSQFSQIAQAAAGATAAVTNAAGAAAAAVAPATSPAPSGRSRAGAPSATAPVSRAKRTPASKRKPVTSKSPPTGTTRRSGPKRPPNDESS